jgi:hypothetical protein
VSSVHEAPASHSIDDDDDNMMPNTQGDYQVNVTPSSKTLHFNNERCIIRNNDESLVAIKNSCREVNRDVNSLLVSVGQGDATKQNRALDSVLPSTQAEDVSLLMEM